MSGGGLTGMNAAKKFGFRRAGSDAAAVLQDDAIDAVVITTRHDSHAAYAQAALEAGKHVFVEKPLCLKADELTAIAAAHAAQAQPKTLMVGFNRRFAPLTVEMKRHLDKAAAPKSMVMTVNAGAIAADHWVQDGDIGGGRIIGEACHFVDLLRHLAGAPIVGHDVRFMQSSTGDTATLNLSFADGSIGTVHYFANGHRGVAKERLDVYCDGRVFQLDNFIRLTGHGWPGFKNRRLWRQDKGQTGCAKAFLDAVRGDAPPPIAFEEVLEVQRVTLDMTS